MTETELILHLLSKGDALSSREIFEKIQYEKSSRTLARLLDKLVAKNLVDRVGVNKGTKYSLSKSYDILHSIDVEEYFAKDIDEREIISSFNHDLLKRDLYQVELFTDSERLKLEDLQRIYLRNVSELTPEEYSKEIERLAIDLSWKSS
ncbi:MAG: helix-turn-helix domain-containing protein, partial [Bacteroidota bacterium]